MFAFIQKLIALLTAMLAFLGFAKGNDKNQEPAADTIATYTVHKNSVVFSFVSNPSTGYGWQYTLNGDSVVFTAEHFECGDKVNTAGAPGKQFYTFTAEKQGKTTVTFIYDRPWENNEPLYNYTAVISVDADLHVSVESFTKANNVLI